MRYWSSTSTPKFDGSNSPWTPVLKIYLFLTIEPINRGFRINTSLFFDARGSQLLTRRCFLASNRENKTVILFTAFGTGFKIFHFVLIKPGLKPITDEQLELKLDSIKETKDPSTQNTSLNY